MNKTQDWTWLLYFVLGLTFSGTTATSDGNVYSKIYASITALVFFILAYRSWAAHQQKGAK